MAKDPAFLFYPGDWVLGTMHLTFLQKGCYMELLILQFSKGKFTEAQAKHMLNGSFDLAWPFISEKFKTDGTYYWNERLNKEKEKRQKFTESRRSNALNPKTEKNNKKHMTEHMHKDMDKHILKHMENENKNENYSDFVCYDVEKFILNNQIAFEKICMATSKMPDEVKKELHMYHLWLAKNEKYPFGKNAAIAGIESWLHNSKQFKQKYNGTDKQVDTSTKFNAGANQLLNQLKGKT